MLMKLSPVVNVKRTNFTYEPLYSSYILALNKLLYKKCVQKTLMKLSPGVDSTKIFMPSFYVHRSQKRKKTNCLSVFFLLLGSPHIKHEIDTRCQCHQHFKIAIFIQKYFVQLFFPNSLDLKFFVERMLVQKLLKKCWWQ